MASRGRTIPGAAGISWWVKLAKDAILADPRGFVQLGKEMASRIGRSRPWSHTTLIRFMNNDAALTYDLAQGIAAIYRMPMPMYFARSLPEAVEMQIIAEKYDAEEARRRHDPPGELVPLATHPKHSESTTGEKHADAHRGRGQRRRAH